MKDMKPMKENFFGQEVMNKPVFNIFSAGVHTVRQYKIGPFIFSNLSAP